MSESEEIKKKVVDQLYWDNRVDSTDISVEVHNGIVKLHGKVPNYNAKGAASADARTIKGVTAVENDIKVEFAPSTFVPSDSEIKSNIESLFRLNYTLDAKDLNISVTAGVATLEGSVDAFWKRKRAEEIASDANGVIDVINKITIVPTKNFLDKDIAEDIIDAITRNLSVNVSNVDVAVENGKVIFKGSVKDWNAYNAAMDAARYTAGVIDIDDNLVIESM
ncbi:MAG: BON domain-containing protein [Candidatus Lokiarchaeota archaeon]|nr:BON domain-containing protein [Candidatus Lokiarchaeota archaeon]